MDRREISILAAVLAFVAAVILLVAEPEEFLRIAALSVLAVAILAVLLAGPVAGACFVLTAVRWINRRDDARPMERQRNQSAALYDISQ